MVVGGGLTNRCEKKRNERQRRKGKTHPTECRVPENSKERYEGLLIYIFFVCFFINFILFLNFTKLY